MLSWCSLVCTLNVFPSLCTSVPGVWLSHDVKTVCVVFKCSRSNLWKDLGRIPPIDIKYTTAMSMTKTNYQAFNIHCHKEIKYHSICLGVIGCQNVFYYDFGGGVEMCVYFNPNSSEAGMLCRM